MRFRSVIRAPARRSRPSRVLAWHVVRGAHSVAAAAQEGYGLRMSDDDLVGEPVWEDVEPRPLTPCEQAMVDHR